MEGKYQLSVVSDKWESDHLFDGCIVDVCDAIPQDVSMLRSDEYGPLANPNL